MIQIFGAVVSAAAIILVFVGIGSRRSALAVLSEDLGYDVRQRRQQPKVPLYDRLLQEFALAGWSLTVPEVLWLWLISSGLFAIVISLVGHLGVMGILFAPLLTAGIGWFMVRFFQTRRTIKMERQLIRALVTISSMLTAAGTTVERAIGEAALRTPAPLGPELRRVADRIVAGGRFVDALEDASKRINTPEWKLFTTAVMLQEEYGGDLPRILTKVVDTMSTRVQDRGEARSLLAEAQMSKLFLTIATPAILGMLMIFDPTQVHALFTTDLWMLGLSLLLWIGGVGTTSWMVRRIEF